MKTHRVQLGQLTAAVVLACALLFAACGGGGGAAPSPGTPRLTIATASLADAVTGRYYIQVLRATGGTPPYEWSASSLPPGLSIAQGTDWLILGYPTQTGTFTPTLQVRDCRSQTASRKLTLVVSEGLLVPSYFFLPNGRVNRPYSYALQATGGQPPYTWSLESGYTLPPGLNLRSSGTVGGTPTAGGNYVFSVKVHDSSTQILTATVFLLIEALYVTPTNLPPAHLDQPYSATLQAEWGDPPFTWSLEPGSSLPPGLSLNGEGVVSGTPTVGGTYYFSVKVQDTTSQIATSWVFLAVLTPLAITTTALPDGNVATDYWTHLEATGGWGYYYWSLEPGSTLPQGIHFDTGGYIGGTPTEAGTFNLTLRATDGDQTATASLSLFIDNRLAILNTWPPYGVVTANYSFKPVALGGTLPYSWSILAGTAGPEYTINAATGEITATPTEAGNFTLTLGVTDSSVPAQTASHQYAFTIFPVPRFLTASLPAAAVQAQYGTAVNVEGGIQPLSVRLVEGTFPPGLNFSSQVYNSPVYISGTPTASGNFAFTLELADYSTPPVTARQQFSIQVNEALTITTTALPGGYYGEPYSAQVAATGGVPPYTWSGPLPQALYIDSLTGEIFGFPMAVSGVVSARVRVTDSGTFPRAVYKDFSINITNPLRIHTTILPPARMGAPYRVSLRAVGGAEPYKWKVSSGSLPSGVDLDTTTGVIAGTPTAEMTGTFAVRVEDSAAPVNSDERTFTLIIVRGLGRNDSIATATLISNGAFRASLSPYADPVEGPANPDTDYYKLTAMPGSIVVLDTLAEVLTPPSPADTVVEILDENGDRFDSCSANLSVLSQFNEPCINDDQALGYNLDSHLDLRVKGTPGIPVTFYVHVLDWSGSARPDFVYDLSIFGAN